MCQCDKRCDKKKCGYITNITKKNFYKNHDLTKSYTICKSGKYSFGEDIVFNPLVEGLSAIVIDADNVSLDLCGFTLSQGNDVLRTTGIHVITGHSNITIVGSNGTITNFSQLGIYVEGGNENIQIGNNDTELLVIKNGGKSSMTFETGIEGGIQLGESKWLEEAGLGPTHGTIKNIRVTNLICNENNPMGIMIGNTINSFYTNSSFSKQYNTRKTIPRLDWFYDFSFGLYILGNGYVGDESVNVNINNCLFNDNIYEDIDATSRIIQSEGAGFWNPLNRGLTVRNSKFDGNGTIGGNDSESYGVVISAGSDVSFEDSSFSNNFGGFYVNGFHQSGFFISYDGSSPSITRSKSTVMRNCIASNNKSDSLLWNDLTNQYQRNFGITFSYNEGLTIENCVSQNNVILSNGLENNNYTGRAIGLRLNGTVFDGEYKDIANVQISNCHITKNTCDSLLGVVVSSGIFTEGVLNSNISISDCVISDNTANGNGINVFDIGIFNNSNTVPVEKFFNIQRCTISNHRTAGIRLVNSLKSLIQNNVISQNEIGVWLRAATDCSSVIENTFTNNEVAVLDINVLSKSLVAYNKGFNNGATPYLVTYAFGPCPVTIKNLTLGFPNLPTVAGENVEVTGSCSFFPLNLKKEEREEVEILEEQ